MRELSSACAVSLAFDLTRGTWTHLLDGVIFLRLSSRLFSSGAIYLIVPLALNAYFSVLCGVDLYLILFAFKAPFY